MLFFPANAPFFAAGMLFFLMQDPQGRSKLRYVLLVSFYLLALRSGSEQIKWLVGHYHDEFSHLVVAGITTLIFIVFFLITRRKLVMGYKHLASLGAITYPLYLIHSDIGFIFFHQVGYQYNKYLVLGSTLAVMLVIAYLINRLVEKPFHKPLGAQISWLLVYLDAK